MRFRLALALIWLVFLIRGLFYSSLLPLWEGYDEYSHFAYVQHLLTRGELPVPKQTGISREVEESLKLVPLPRMLSARDQAISYSDYWRLPQTERDRRQAALQAWNGAVGASSETGSDLYEAQQPPLYYWLMTPVLWIAEGESLATRVFILRLASVALASLVIPIGFLAAREVLQNAGAAVAAVALIPAMPELMIDIARVGNDALSAPLYSALLYLGTRLAREPANRRLAAAFGTALGLGLLNKAYFLAAIPPALGLIFWIAWKHRAFRSSLSIVALPLAISAWWYVRTHGITGTWTGQIEDSMIQTDRVARLLRASSEAGWSRALDSILLSHIWFGGWSFLQVRSWIYHLFMAIIAVAAAGLLLRPRSIPVLPAAFYGVFWLGLGYHTVAVFAVKRLSASNGWYLYAVVVAEVVLATIGLWNLLPAKARLLVLPCGALLFAALDLYGANFLLAPYYSGMIAHRANGTFEVFRIEQFSSAMLFRLGGDHPSLFGGLWIISILATLALPVIAYRVSTAPAPGEGSQR